MQVRERCRKAERQKMRCMHAYITDIVVFDDPAGTLYRFTSPPSKRTCVSIAMSANLKKIAQLDRLNVGRYEAMNEMTLVSHTILFKMNFETVLFANLLHAGETPARGSPLDLEACLFKLLGCSASQ